MKTSLKELQKQIAALEKEHRKDPVILHFADGTTRTIRGTFQHWNALNATWCGWRDGREELMGEVEALRTAVRIEESDGELFNLLRVMMIDPISTGSVNP